MTLAEGRALLRRRLEQRSADLLTLLDRAVSARADHPYHVLLRALPGSSSETSSAW